MKAFTGYPELFNDEVDGSNPAIVFKNGTVVAVGTEDSRSDMERLVVCWNACRKIFAPAAHIEASDEQVLKLERLRKEAWSLAGSLQVELDQLKSSALVASTTGWSRDIASAPRGRTVQTQRLVTDKNSASGQALRLVSEFIRDDVILNTKCSKALRSYWIPDEQRWAGLSKGEEPIAWMHWPTPLQVMESTTTEVAA